MKLTKAIRRDRCRALIDFQPHGREFPPDVLAEFNALTGVPVLGAKRMVNHEFPKDTRHVYANKPGVGWEPFSWIKAISPPKARTELKKWLRDEIQCDLEDYRSAALLQECARCGCPENLTTDHKTIPFDQIAEAWLMVNGEPELVSGPGNQGAMIRDRDLAANWIEFHAKMSTYQILCRSCNASKGRGVLNGQKT